MILPVPYEFVSGNFAVALVAVVVKNMLTERAYETQQFFM